MFLRTVSCKYQLILGGVVGINKQVGVFPKTLRTVSGSDIAEIKPVAAVGFSRTAKGNRL